MKKIRLLHFINVIVFIVLKILSREYEQSDWTQLVDTTAIFFQMITIFITEVMISDKNRFSVYGKFLYTLGAVLAFLLFSFYSESTVIEEEDETLCRIRLISILLNQINISDKTMCELFEIGSIFVLFLLVITDISIIVYTFCNFRKT